MTAHVIYVPGAEERKLVFQKNGVSVYAFLVDHRPIELQPFTATASCDQ